MIPVFNNCLSNLVQNFVYELWIFWGVTGSSPKMILLNMNFFGYNAIQSDKSLPDWFGMW